MKKSTLILLMAIITTWQGFAQYPVFRGCPVTVDFSQKLRIWDGFGFNYVETAQTIDYATNPTDYGGFSIMNEQSRNEIIEYTSE